MEAAADVLALLIGTAAGTAKQHASLLEGTAHTRAGDQGPQHLPNIETVLYLRTENAPPGLLQDHQSGRDSAVPVRGLRKPNPQRMAERTHQGPAGAGRTLQYQKRRHESKVSSAAMQDSMCFCRLCWQRVREAECQIHACVHPSVHSYHTFGVSMDKQRTCHIMNKSQIGQADVPPLGLTP